MRDAWIRARSAASLRISARCLLLQNAKFDYKMLRAQAGIGMRNMYDTMLVERVLTAVGISREIGLAKIALKYTGLVPGQSRSAAALSTSTGAFTDDQLRYAARDAQILFDYRLRGRNADLLKRERLREVALSEFKTVIAVSDDGSWRGCPDRYRPLAHHYRRRYRRSGSRLPGVG